MIFIEHCSGRNALLQALYIFSVLKANLNLHDAYYTSLAVLSS